MAHLVAGFTWIVVAVDRDWHLDHRHWVGSREGSCAVICHNLTYNALRVQVIVVPIICLFYIDFNQLFAFCLFDQDPINHMREFFFFPVSSRGHKGDLQELATACWIWWRQLRQPGVWILFFIFYPLFFLRLIKTIKGNYILLKQLKFRAFQLIL